MRVVELSVGPERARAALAFDPEEPLRTSDVPGLVARARACLPGLGRHRCTAGARGSLAGELPDTELAHLVEHVALELMALAGSPRTLAGSTDWDFSRDGRGVFVVSLEHDHARACGAAIREAMALVRALAAGETPDAEASSARVAGARCA